MREPLLSTMASSSILIPRIRPSRWLILSFPSRRWSAVRPHQLKFVRSFAISEVRGVIALGGYEAAEKSCSGGISFKTYWNQKRAIESCLPEEYQIRFHKLFAHA